MYRKNARGAPSASRFRRLFPHCAFAGRRGAVSACLFLAAVCSFSFAEDKSGVGPNVINVPNGPGSLGGLGQTFQPQLNTGTASYRVPLTVTPGTAGQTPQLTLSYKNGGRNSVLGYGWSCGIPFVERRTSIGLPRYVDGPNYLDDDGDGFIDEPDDGPPDEYTDEPDRFANQSGMTLVSLGAGDYRCRYEGSFIRYRRIGEHWEGVLPTGVRMDFGLTAQARVYREGTSDVARWCLERITDTNGNCITYRYKSFPGDTNRNQKYIDCIEYGPGAPPWDSFHFVSFRYESRPDWFETCRFRFPWRTGMRMSEILVGTQGPVLEGHVQGDFNVDTVTDSLVRRYRLTYEAHPHWSMLSSVTPIGMDGSSELPPISFRYTIANPPDVTDNGGAFIGSVNEPNAVMDNSLVELVDLNADSLPDMLRTAESGGAQTAYVNYGIVDTPDGQAIQWDGPHEVATADGLAWGVDLASKTRVARLADMNGDGMADLVYRNTLAEVAFFKNEGNLGWGPRQAMAPAGDAPLSPFGRTDVRQTDVDSNKKVDVIQSVSVGVSAHYRVWFNLGNQVFSKPVTVPQDNGIMFDLSGVKIADMNGDKVPDICRIQALIVTVLPGLGYGEFASPVTVQIPEGPLDELRLKRTALRDITGDGLPDLVVERAEPGTLWYWVNLGNYTFDHRRIIRRMPTGIGFQPTIRWADLNGNGTKDLIYADREVVPKLQVVDMGELLGYAPGEKLLMEIDNGVGLVTSIEYTRSTKFAMDDLRAGTPWPNLMPINLGVVSRVVTHDGMGNEYVSEFTYHDPYYDPKYKAFRGFARVEQRDFGDDTAPTLVSHYTYDTGHEVKARKGKMLRLVLAQEDGSVFEETEHEWSVTRLAEGPNGGKVDYAYATATTYTSVELGQGPPRTTETEFEYDEYGNVLRTVQWGVVEDGDRTAFDDEVVKVNEYAINTDLWMLRKKSRQEIRDENGVVTARSERYYDDPTFSGENVGFVSKGNETLVKQWRDASVAEDFAVVSRMVYDEYGNNIANLEPGAVAPGGVIDEGVGHLRRVTFDPDFHTYPVEERLIGGGESPDIVYRAVYDLGLGVVTETTDPNGYKSDFGYDVYGRLASIREPGDTAEYPTNEYSYVLGHSLGDGKTVNYVETRELDQTPGAAGVEKRDHYHIARNYEDGLGRVLLKKEEASRDPETGAPRIIVTDAARYNARRKPVALLRNYFSRLPSPDLDGLLAFEDIGSEGWKGTFHEDGELVALNLPQAHKVTYLYDARLRDVKVTDPTGAFSRLVYEPLVSRTYDQNDTDPVSPHYDTPVVVHKDGRGLVIQVDEIIHTTPGEAPETWSTRYTYDVNGRRTRVTDAQGNVRLMEYDSLKRMTYMNDPDRGEMRFRHNDANNVVESTDARGQTIRYTYDGFGRILTVDYLDEGLPFSAERSPDVTYHYDVAGGPVDLGNGTVATPRNTLGMLVRATDLAGEEYFSYDARGRTEWNTKRLPDPRTGTPVSYTVWAEHDSMDRTTLLTYPDGDRITNEFDDGSDLDRIVGGAGANLQGTPYIIRDTQYSPDGRSSALIYGNDVATEFDYDRRGRPSTIRTYPLTRPAEPLADHAYTYDAMTHMLRIEDRRPESLIPPGDPRRDTKEFVYDDVYRLTHATLQAGSIDYRYDRIGNMLAKSSNISHLENGRPVADLGVLRYGGGGGTHNRVGRSTAAPGPHALSGTASGEVFDYDANGNMTSIGGLACTWDFKDRLVAVESPTMRAEYTYDYTDRRAIKRVWQRASANDPFPQQPTTAALYPHEFFEIRDSGVPVKYVKHETTRIARILGTVDDTAERTIRYRVFPGWNLLSMAVQTDEAAAQLGVDAPNVLGCYRYEADGSYTPIHVGDALPARSVFWLRVEAADSLPVKGQYTPPALADLPAGGGYVAAPGLNPVQLNSFLPENTELYRFFDAATQAWVTRYRGPLEGLSTAGAPEYLQPGQAVFVRLSGPATVVPPPPGNTIQYYHHDHLGSSDLVSSAAGEVLYETAYYPFGYVRHQFDSGTGLLPNHYEFLHKERDRETGLHYFEARYLSAPLARFASVDPMIFDPPSNLFLEPQQLNPYAYARSNPVAYRDPSGRATNEYQARADAALDNWNKMSTPNWLAKHQKHNFKSDYGKLVKGKSKFGSMSRLRGTLYGMQKSKSNPGEFVRCNDKMAKFIKKHNLGVKPRKVLMTKTAKLLGKKEEISALKHNMISRKALGQAIDDAANKKIHAWINKVRKKLGMKPMADWKTHKDQHKTKLAMQHYLGKKLSKASAEELSSARYEIGEAKKRAAAKKEAEGRKIVKLDHYKD